MTTALTSDQVRALCAVVEIWSDRKVVLIGAGALGLQLAQPGRITHDLDLTVAANVVDTTAALRKLGFTRHENAEHRWLGHGGVRLDILPITAEDMARGTLVWPESGHVMGVRGFDLVFMHTHALALDDEHSIDIAMLPVLVLLKMEAWLDRLGLDLDAIAQAHHRTILQRFLDSFTDTESHHFERLASAGSTGGRDRRVAAQQRLALFHRGLRLL